MILVQHPGNGEHIPGSAWNAVRRVATLLCCAAAAIWLWERRSGNGDDVWRHVLLWMLAGRLIVLSMDILAGRRRWSRAIIPAAAVLKIAAPERLPVGPSGTAGAIGVALLELLVLVLMWRILSRRSSDHPYRFPEKRLADSLALVLPDRAAKAIAVEMVVLSSAVWSIGRGLRVRGLPGYAYASASVFWILPVIVLLLGPLDLVIVRQVFRLRNRFVDIGMSAVEIWSVLWLYGIYVTMCERPHTIGNGSLEVHQGILKCASIPLQHLYSARALADGAAGKSEGSVAKLTVAGAPRVRLGLSAPVRVKRLWGRDVQATVVIVSAANPALFLNALREAKAGRSQTLVSG